MDSPTLEQSEHRRALDGLKRINEVSHAAQTMLDPILALSRRANLKKISILDVACGGGDVPVALAVLAGRQGVTIDLTLFDRSEVALRQAEERAREAGVVIRTITGDAIAGLPPVRVDIVTNSLFLHHLQAQDVVPVLRHMRAAADRAVIISDLRRSVAGLAVAWTACRVLSRSPVMHYDGPASVRAAWTMEELAVMAGQAGMEGGRISRRWPWRMQLVWERTSGRGAGNA